MVRSMVNSVKHYVQISLETVVAGAVDSIVISKAVVANAVNTASEVREGCSIKAVYAEMWVRTGSVSEGSIVAILEKLPGVHAANPTAAEMAALFSYENKKNILYTTQGLTNDENNNAIAMYKGWIKIPKGKQRQGLNDQIKWHTFAQALDQIICGFFLYKEYY